MVLIISKAIGNKLHIITRIGQKIKSFRMVKELLLCLCSNRQIEL